MAEWVRGNLEHWTGDRVVLGSNPAAAPTHSAQILHTAVAFFKRSKVNAAFILAMLKRKYLAGNM